MWGPRFTHNISLFYPQAILNYFGVTPNMASYVRLMAAVTVIIEEEVMLAANNLNSLVKQEFRKDIAAIAEYSVIDYWSVLETALSSPVHIGVTWGPKLVQAKFIDTDALGGLKELIEIQKAVYPKGSGNLGAWASLYARWIRGEDDRIGDTLEQRLSIMRQEGIAPFAELIEYGNEGYPAYPTHTGMYTLTTFKPHYNKEMSAAFQRVLAKVGPMASAAVTAENMVATSIVENAVPIPGFTWVSKSGKMVFVYKNRMTIKNNRPYGFGYIISPTGTVQKEWHGWMP